MKQPLTTSLLAAATLLLVAATSLVACTSQPSASPREAVKVRTVAAARSEGAATRRYAGTIEEISGTVASFETGGHVTAVYADAGDRVAAGERLAAIDDAELSNLHAAALATLEQAADARRRYGELHRQGTLPDIQWQEVETKHKQAEAAERVARDRLDDCVLRAPVGGYVAERMADAGSNVAPGQPVFRIVDIRRVRVKIAVPESEISAFRTGQPLRFSVAALGGSLHEARVTEKGVTADPLSHTYLVKAELDNPGGRLLPGMVCDVVAESGAAPGSIVVPVRAVQPDIDGKKFVWLDVKGRATRRAVATGRLVEGGVEVTSGLQAGERVVVEGAQKISEGMNIAPAP